MNDSRKIEVQLDSLPPLPEVRVEVPVITRDDLVATIKAAMSNVPDAGEIADALLADGFVVEGVPVCRTVLTDAQTFAERTILAELVVRLFRFYIMGSIVLPDTPAAMDWLKSFIDGTNGQGPLGAGPLLWPRLIPSAVNLLERWGFQPTPSEPPYVIKRRGR